MQRRLTVVVAGRSKDALAKLEGQMRGRSDVSVVRKQLVNGHADPLHDCSELPDALVLAVGVDWKAELAALSERSPSLRPPLLVVGPSGDAELIRAAMRAGARDYFDMPVARVDLEDFLESLVRDREASSTRVAAAMTAVINAKGGSGASMIAANLAHNMVLNPDRRVVLMDLDVQFGALPSYFNLMPRNGLVRALDQASSMDEVALEGYVQCHESGLDVIASAPEDLILTPDIPETHLDQLLKVLSHAYQDIVVDLPRWIAGSTAMVLERASRVLVVTQQSIVHLRDAKRMVDILRHELGVDNRRVIVVVNRYDRQDPVDLQHIRDVLPQVEVMTLPNDFRRVNESINAGSPLYDVARRSPVTRQLQRLASSLHVGPDSEPKPQRSWRLLPWARD